MTRAAAVFVAALALCAPLVACNGVLGIDSAMLDPDASTEAGAVADSDPLTCANYCKVVSQNCSGEFVEYLPSEVGAAGATDPCMYLCTNYLSRNLGTYAPPTGPEPVAEMGQPGTLSCRLWHAHAAGSTKHPEIHCRHAGPLGSELCGDPCASFCNLDFSYCVDDNSVPAYSSQAQCQSACTDMVGTTAPDAGFVYDQTIGDLVDDAGGQTNSGNTLNCRLWHLETSIQESMPSMHCWHTASPSLNPGGLPGGPCGG